MAAIEYGSYYWCVLLNGDGKGQAGESIHLHADEVSLDGGNLVFKSAGRRPAGTEPKANGADSGGDSGNEKKNENNADKTMIYMAFAAGSWKLFYAAKLQDGSPASVEHWNKAEAERPEPDSVPANAGVSGAGTL